MIGFNKLQNYWLLRLWEMAGQTLLESAARGEGAEFAFRMGGALTQGAPLALGR